MEVFLWILYFAVLALMPVIGCIYDVFDKSKCVMIDTLCSDEEICLSLNEELESLTDKEWQMLGGERTEEDVISRQMAIEAVHDAIYQFLDNAEEVTQWDKTWLPLIKAVCRALRELPKREGKENG